jgi:hypothetical protein
VASEIYGGCKNNSLTYNFSNDPVKIYQESLKAEGYE